MGVPHTVSGISSGGFQAVQHHVAFSSDVTAVGVIAGGPFWCANALLSVAMTACQHAPELISVDELVTVTHTTALSGFIDSPRHLKGDSVWLFSGSRDSTVNPGVVRKLAKYYENFSADVTEEYTVPAEHAFVTAGWGSPCAFSGAPYINDCGFDSAGAILHSAYNRSWAPLNPRARVTPASNVVAIDQSKYAPLVGLVAAGLWRTGYAYVPTSCAAVLSELWTSGAPPVEGVPAACRLHVAYHGCEQSAEVLNMTFISHAGYNEWAESNQIVVLYPQATATPLNPKGCWDWWGYTGKEYASNLGLQLRAVRKMVEHLSGLLERGVSSSRLAVE